MAYLLDANVFIEAKNRHYGFDFCPAFWEWIIEKFGEGRVFSIDKIHEELAGVSEDGDDLSTWADNLGSGFFLEARESLPTSLSMVSAWATGPFYRADAIATFLSKADYYLVAQAHDRGFTVVTHETSALTPTKIKIPNACVGVGVRPITPYEMLRIERARFVLPSA